MTIVVARSTLRLEIAILIRKVRASESDRSSTTDNFGSNRASILINYGYTKKTRLYYSVW